jgi:hypothetical protein
VASTLVAGPVAAQVPSECFDPADPTPEVYGPTDISATTGNQNLSAAINPDATVTVLKWPSPSFYDQIKYRTRDRSLPRFGALPNEGAFLGLAWRKAGVDKWAFQWLRRWRSTQRFADADTDEIVTTFRKRKLGLRVTVRDLVAHDLDAFLRRVKVIRTKTSRVQRVRVVAFANFNPVFSKSAQAPVQDWCFEEGNDDGGDYLQRRDAIVHERSGIDESTGATSSSALVLAFDETSERHHVGADTYETPSGGTSAYDDASDGRLSGGNSASGQADAALANQLSLASRRSASTTVIIAAGATRADAVQTLAAARRRSFGVASDAKATWWAKWLKSAPLPRDAPGVVVRLAKRALISLRQAIDADTPDIDEEDAPNLSPGNLIVASIATQSPYGEDWIRDGAYLNYALDVAGHHATVRRHNFRYAVLQTKAGDSARGGGTVPPGNWAMNFYADGVVGGTIPYEIDETGYGIWTLWNHYQFTKDINYLFSDHEGVVYLAIQRAAQYLTDVCKDLTTNLQCVANEDDNPNPSQTLKGAMLVWLGLDSAAKAARVLNTVDSRLNAAKWAARRDELAAAIQTNFFDVGCSCYTADFEDGGTLLWPVRFLDFGSQTANAQAKVNWNEVSPAFAGKANRGRYEAKALLGNAHAWAGRPAKQKLLKEGLRWVARVPTTNETGLLGEAWMRYPTAESSIKTMVSQPHVWEQVLFYLAALKVYGKQPYRFR